MKLKVILNCYLMHRYGLVASLFIPVHLLPLITIVPSIGMHLCCKNIFTWMTLLPSTGMHLSILTKFSPEWPTSLFSSNGSSIGMHLNYKNISTSITYLLSSIAFLLLSALLPESPVWLIRWDPTFDQHFIFYWKDYWFALMGPVILWWSKRLKSQARKRRGGKSCFAVAARSLLWHWARGEPFYYIKPRGLFYDIDPENLSIT